MEDEMEMEMLKEDQLEVGWMGIYQALLPGTQPGEKRHRNGGGQGRRA